MPCPSNTALLTPNLFEQLGFDLRMKKTIYTTGGRECDRCSELLCGGEKSCGAAKGREPFLQSKVRGRERERKRAAHRIHVRCCGMGMPWVTMGDHSFLE